MNFLILQKFFVILFVVFITLELHFPIFAWNFDGQGHRICENFMQKLENFMRSPIVDDELGLLKFERREKWDWFNFLYGSCRKSVTVNDILRFIPSSNSVFRWHKINAAVFHLSLKKFFSFGHKPSTVINEFLFSDCLTFHPLVSKNISGRWARGWLEW